ncbi:MAG: hypothetical protein DBY05_10055 [Clostridiales bacterium]|jgi:hypothetical protein|nr:MAG: hypothetical protein DBY05_10055 [Clostridiales bacterium]
MWNIFPEIALMQFQRKQIQRRQVFRKGCPRAGFRPQKRRKKGTLSPFRTTATLILTLKIGFVNYLKAFFSKLLLQTEVFLLKTAEKSSYKPLNPSMAESGALQKTFRIIFPKG